MKKYAMSLVGLLFLLSISAVASAQEGGGPVNLIFEGICTQVDGVNINCAYAECVRQAQSANPCVVPDVLVDVDLLDVTHAIDNPGGNNTSVYCSAVCGPDVPDDQEDN